MKVLLLASTYPRWKRDNTNAFIEDLAQNIVKQGKDYKVVVIAPHFKGAKKKETSLDGRLEVHRIQYAFPASSQRVFYEGGAANRKKGAMFAFQTLCYCALLFVKALSLSITKGIDVINAHWILPQGIMALIVSKITRKALVVSVHGGDIFTLRGKLPTLFKRLVLKGSNAVTVNSSTAEAACQEIVPREYDFGPMGVEVAHFSQHPKTYKGKKKKILFVGRVSEEKGLATLIKALPDITHDFEVDIVGSGPYLKTLQQLASRSKSKSSIHFPGWIDQKDLPEYYANADVFVGPSITLSNGWREAMGVVYLEALVCNVPVITTVNAGARDFVEDGVNGRVVGENEPKELASAINDILENSYQTKKFKTKLQQIEQTYSWKSCTERYLEVYERV